MVSEIHGQLFSQQFYSPTKVQNAPERDSGSICTQGAYVLVLSVLPVSREQRHPSPKVLQRVRVRQYELFKHVNF